MTDSHMRTKIKEAFIAAGHNRHDAQKLLLTWAVRDPALLLAMTKPHLKAIAAAHIEHYARQLSEGEPMEEDNEKFSRATIDDIVASSTGRGSKKRHSPLPPPKVTERQASTMRKLAAAFTRKKK